MRPYARSHDDIQKAAKDPDFHIRQKNTLHIYKTDAVSYGMVKSF